MKRVILVVKSEEEPRAVLMDGFIVEKRPLVLTVGEDRETPDPDVILVVKAEEEPDVVVDRLAGGFRVEKRLLVLTICVDRDVNPVILLPEAEEKVDRLVDGFKVEKRLLDLRDGVDTENADSDVLSVTKTEEEPKVSDRLVDGFIVEKTLLASADGVDTEIIESRDEEAKRVDRRKETVEKDEVPTSVVKFPKTKYVLSPDRVAVTSVALNAAVVGSAIG